MGAFNTLGSLAGGIAAGRDNRKANDARDAQTSLMKQVMLSKAKPADGLGGKPVTETGANIELTPEAASIGTKPVATGMKKVGQAIGSGFKTLLGFKDGGRITKSGVAYLHSGETIVPASKSAERKAMRTSARRSGRR